MKWSLPIVIDLLVKGRKFETIAEVKKALSNNILLDIICSHIARKTLKFGGFEFALRVFKISRDLDICF